MGLLLAFDPVMKYIQATKWNDIYTTSINVYQKVNADQKSHVADGEAILATIDFSEVEEEEAIAA